jgi:hypothetical protein
MERLRLRPTDTTTTTGVPTLGPKRKPVTQGEQ